MEPRITKESDLGRWTAFMKEWKLEHEPGHLIIGKQSYRVLRLPGDRVEFQPESTQDLYESRSFQ